MIDIGLPYYRFGSKDSIDMDILIDHPNSTGIESDKILFSKLQNKYPEIKSWNANIIKIENGIVVASIPSKGSIDSVHNSLFDTFSYHEQKYPFPLMQKQQRNVMLAVIKCVKTLMFIFKTGKRKPYYKSDLHYVLVGGSFEDYHNKILELDFSKELFAESNRNLNLYKSLIFRIAQTISLVDGVEIYTKDKLKLIYPDTTPIIDRQIVDNINEIFKKYIDILHQKIADMNISQYSADVVKWEDNLVNIRTERPI